MRSAWQIQSINAASGTTFCCLQTIWFSAHPALFSELCRYPPSDDVLTPAISPITGRLVSVGASYSFPYRSKGPAHWPPKMWLLQRNCVGEDYTENKYQNLEGYHKPRYQIHRICLQSWTIAGYRPQSKHIILMQNPTHTKNSAGCRLHSQ